MKIVKLENVSKIYTAGDHELKAMDNVNLELEKGEFIVILGPSGAGKSTLLNLLGGLDTATSGKITVDNTDISKLSSDELANYRAEKVGFVFQFYNLLPTLTVYENIALVNEISKNHLDPLKLLDEVGLLDHKDNFPSELSGGEQQRVSIARALVKNPEIILCDEPTGALDSKTGVMILELLQKMCKEHQKTVIIVTHNQNIAKIADTIIRVKNGKVVSYETNQNPLSTKEVEW